MNTQKTKTEGTDTGEVGLEEVEAKGTELQLSENEVAETERTEPEAMEVKGMQAKEKETKEAEVRGAETKLGEANKIIKNRVLWAMGVGLVPIPLVDLAGLTVVQLDMARVLCKLYDVPFRKDAGKSIIASLLGSVVPVSLTPGLYSLIKAIPLIGQTTGAVTMSLAGGAATYAVGKVLVQHFESGGTFLDFDPEKVKDYFAEQYKEGEKVAAELKGGK